MRDLAAEIRNTQVPPRALAIWWLGQESVVVKGGGKTLCFDLYLSDSCNLKYGLQRRFPPPLPPEAVDFADLVFSSHEHEDHLDPHSLGPIARSSPGARFVVPQCCVPLAEQAGVPRERVVPSRAGEPLDLDGVAVLPIKCAHDTFDLEEQGHRWQGFIVRLNGVTFCHIGDTVIYEGLDETLREQGVQLLMAPINGRDFYRTRAGVIGNMQAREAAELAVAAGVQMLIPLHYDLFANNAEQPGYLVDYLCRYHPEQACHVMARFERFFYMPGA